MSAILHSITTSIENDRHKIHLKSWKNKVEKDKEEKLQKKRDTVDRLLKDRATLHKKILNLCKLCLKEFDLSEDCKCSRMSYSIGSYEFPFYKWKYNPEALTMFSNESGWYADDEIFTTDSDIINYEYYNEFERVFLLEIENWLIGLDEDSMRLSLLDLDNLEDIYINFEIDYYCHNGCEIDIKGSLL
jgi:hypothetical protein